MLIFWLILQILVLDIYSDAACTWPVDFVDSTWIDSLKGDMVFTSTHMSGWSFDVSIQAPASVQTLDSWECVVYDETGPYLIMKTTDTFTQFVTQQYTSYRCIIPEKITDYFYRYYQTEPIQPVVKYERVFIHPSRTLSDPSVLCQNPSDGPDFQVMIKKGNETSAKIICPYKFLVDYTFTYSKSDGTVTCDADNDEGTISMCTDITEMSLQAPACSPYPLYSSGNTSWCVDVVTVGSDTFLSLYNGQQDSDESNTYQFVCVGINSDGTSMSVTPQHCKANQNSTEIPVDNSGSNVGAVLSLSASGVPCPTLSNPFRGNVIVSTNGAVTTATYSCDDNNTLYGNDTRICHTDGTWSDSQPSCSCQIPSSLSNGNMEISDGGLASTCDTGYVLVGSSTLTCNTDTLIWSDAYPTCEKCQTLSAPTNGSVTIAGTGVTLVASYSCDAGTTSNGESSRTCKVDTTWTNTAPTCILCPTLSHIASGNVTLSTDDITTAATYYCGAGYSLKGDNTSVCTVSGTWDSTPPICQCNAPSSPDNGIVRVSDDQTQADYRCNIGFTLEGVNTRNCRVDGTGWSGNDPVCAGCPTPSGPMNGILSISTNGTLTVATYSCETGFTLNWDVSSQCQADGSWSTISPTCLPTASSTETGCSSSNLLPVVIVLAVSTVGLGIAFGLSMFYLRKIKKEAPESFQRHLDL